MACPTRKKPRQRGTDKLGHILRSAEQKMKSNPTRPEMEQAGEQSAAAGTPSTPDRRRILVALQAENAKLRHQVVNLALEIQKLRSKSWNSFDV